MRKYLASVGNAKLLARKGDTLEHIADIRTLTESTLSFTNSMEEVRAGEGAQLIGRFSHTTGMTINLTDALFDMNYIALQVGDELNRLNATGFVEEEFTKDDIKEGNKIELSKEVGELGDACGLDKKVVWYRQSGCGADTEWKISTTIDADGKKVTLTDIDTTRGVCVNYLAKNTKAKIVDVKSNFIPAECILLLTTKVFAAESTVETGKAVGTVTFKIPRFQLNGTFDLNMAMAAASTTSLQGTALAVDSNSCDGGGIYAEIVEVDYDDKFYDGLKMIAIDPDTVVRGQAPVVYGLYKTGSTSQLDNGDEELVFDPELDDTGKIAANEKKTELIVKVVVDGKDLFESDPVDITGAIPPAPEA